MDTQKKLALAARYRPQTFAEVAGQDMVRAVLSKVCADDSPAPAYLFSGTRGVGKTTIARIFAKALNCEHAPCPEPCNSCPTCRKITQGVHVDVIEIDGASNNGVEDIRTLRENVGYAPMEGRYKIFIIDEAHMLSNSAFNALLKTLEEPPGRVVFILATTEAHKFPVTIVSRCQHFTFRHLSEEELLTHLTRIMAKEGLSYEEDALHLIAKRGEGSVRDSMSLLDQTLALGGSELSLAVTRRVLGLAGSELFLTLFTAIAAKDAAAVLDVTRTLLRQGVDIGFFLRELAGFIKTLFLHEAIGPSVAKSLDLTPQDLALVSHFAHTFSAAYLHAAWQLVLEGHRSVVQSSEPASALELLLLNLTLLPCLLPLDALQNGMVPGTASALDSSRHGETEALKPIRVSEISTATDASLSRSSSLSSSDQADTSVSQASLQLKGTQQEDSFVLQAKESANTTSATSVEQQSFSAPLSSSSDRVTLKEKRAHTKGIREASNDALQNSSLREDVAHFSAKTAHSSQEASQPSSPSPVAQTVERELSALDNDEYESDDGESFGLVKPLDWQAFASFCLSGSHEGLKIPENMLRRLNVEHLGTHVRFLPSNQVLFGQLREAESFFLERLKSFLHNPAVLLEIVAPEHSQKSQEKLEALTARPELAPCRTIFDAVVEKCRER